jgi:lipase chaperone LimK
MLSVLKAEASLEIYEQLQKAAEEHGKSTYDALVHEHQGRIERERKKMDYAFSAHQRIIARIGLPQVRNHRLGLLAQEEKRILEQLERKSEIYPEMVPLLMVRVESCND